MPPLRRCASVRIDGQPVTGPLKISGMAFQAPSLLPWRTTLDNVLLPFEIVEPHKRQFRSQRARYEALRPSLEPLTGSLVYLGEAPERAAAELFPCTHSLARPRWFRG